MKLKKKHFPQNLLQLTKYEAKNSLQNPYFSPKKIHPLHREIYSHEKRRRDPIIIIILTIPPYRKDARLPENLQRAMAAEAEAAREARAKVIILKIYWGTSHIVKIFQ